MRLVTSVRMYYCIGIEADLGSLLPLLDVPVFEAPSDLAYSAGAVEACDIARAQDRSLAYTSLCSQNLEVKGEVAYFVICILLVIMFGIWLLVGIRTGTSDGLSLSGIWYISLFCSRIFDSMMDFALYAFTCQRDDFELLMTQRQRVFQYNNYFWGGNSASCINFVNSCKGDLRTMTDLESLACKLPTPTDDFAMSFGDYGASYGDFGDFGNDSEPPCDLINYGKTIKPIVLASALIGLFLLIPDMFVFGRKLGLHNTQGRMQSVFNWYQPSKTHAIIILGLTLLLQSIPQLFCAIMIAVNFGSLSWGFATIPIASAIFSLFTVLSDTTFLFRLMCGERCVCYCFEDPSEKFDEIEVMQKEKASKKPEKIPAKEKKKEATEDGKSTSVSKANPMYVPQESAGESGGAGGYLEISVAEEPTATATSKDVGNAASVEDSVVAAAPAPDTVPEESFGGFEDDSSSTAAEQPAQPKKSKTKKKKSKKENSKRGNVEWNALHLTKKEALQTIMGGKPGSFVIRASDKAVAVLSMIKPDSKMYNRLIEETPSGFCLAKTPSQTFSSLNDIAQHYATPAHAEKGGLPCPLLF